MKIKVLSQYLFDEDMKKMGLNDDNVEKTNMAFISIIGTPECLTYYLDEGNTKHYFKNHQNVLNIEFDDIGDDVMYNGHHFKTISILQAENAVDFIEKIVKSWPDCVYIHCRAGFSRSRAFAEFIYRYCKENNIEVEYEDRDNYTTMLNYGVLKKLEHAYWKKHSLKMYSDGKTEYPDDIVNTQIITINRKLNKCYWELN